MNVSLQIMYAKLYKIIQIFLCVCPARTLFKTGSDMADILDMTIYKPRYNAISSLQQKC